MTDNVIRMTKKTMVQLLVQLYQAELKELDVEELWNHIQTIALAKVSIDLILTGNTYNCREYIKKLGGRWNAEKKAWVIDIARNTMNKRASLDLEIRELENNGCFISYE